ncbi:MAG: bifunctional phosphoglucose/phosphomannose isomerase [Saprospiraceae bacterium]|nr:bifunctional phosphoglucose/phosphomannose isomerase [Saprospiraceae bacterium]
MIEQFPDTILDGINLGKSLDLGIDFKNIRNVFVSGMGGSGIGADFIHSFVKEDIKLPFVVGKSYGLPGWVDESTFLIISSYSGNTEETISALNTGIQKAAKILVISSGGEIIKIAEKNHLPCIKLPANWSSPRACLGFSIAAQLTALMKAGLVPQDKITELENAAQFLKSESIQIKEKSIRLADALSGKMIVSYCEDHIEPVALRFRQQINENSKRLCWHQVIPEMNHNELVGWRQNNPHLAVLLLRNANDYFRNSQRMDLTKEVVSLYSGAVVELYSKGKNLIERSLYLVHLLDFVSVHLAHYNGVDPIEVKVIDYLKSELSGIKA